MLLICTHAVVGMGNPQETPSSQPGTPMTEATPGTKATPVTGDITVGSTGYHS